MGSQWGEEAVDKENEGDRLFRKPHRSPRERIMPEDKPGRGTKG